MFLRFKQLHFSNLTPWAALSNSHCREANCRFGCFLSCSRPPQSTRTVLKQFWMSFFFLLGVLPSSACHHVRGRLTCCQIQSLTHLFVPADSEGAHMALMLRRSVYLQGDVKNVPINSSRLFCLLAVSPLLPPPATDWKQTSATVHGLVSR